VGILTIFTDHDLGHIVLFCTFMCHPVSSNITRMSQGGESAMSEVAELIRARLDEKGWSVRELARRADIPQATVHKIVSGQAVQPRMETLECIARPLGISSKSLLAAAASDAGYVTTTQDADGLNLLIAGLRELPPSRQREIAALIEAMLTASKNDT